MEISQEVELYQQRWGRDRYLGDEEAAHLVVGCQDAAEALRHRTSTHRGPQAVDEVDVAVPPQTRVFLGSRMCG